ncbi:MAG: DUF4830 domain-containing protein [Candidatus Ornithomonoglobus sp.]
MRIKKLFILSLAVIMITAAAFCVFADESDIDKSIEFLDSYGWSVAEKPVEESEVKIPAEFDEVYKSYNIIQNEAGLDLMPYRGMSGTRYTFIVTNYPVDVGEPVRANVICIEGVPVAGDIMTVSINGFMHSLEY